MRDYCVEMCSGRAEAVPSCAGSSSLLRFALMALPMQPH